MKNSMDTESKPETTAKPQVRDFAAALERLRPPKTRQLAAREIRRLQRRDLNRQEKKGTRSWRRSKIQAGQDAANAIGLARVYLLGTGTPAMQATVKHHVEVTLASQVSSELDIDLPDALAAITERFKTLIPEELNA